jgi:hypothetical protein
MSVIKRPMVTVLRQNVSTLDDCGRPADVFLQLRGRRIRRSGGRHPERRRRALLVALPQLGHSSAACRVQSTIEARLLRLSCFLMLRGGLSLIANRMIAR